MFTPLLRICLAGFVMDAAVQVAFIAAPFFIIRVLHGDAALTGLAGAAQAIAYAAVCMVSSRFVGKLSNGLHAAVLGAAIFTVAFSAIPFFPSKTACLSLIALGSTGLALFWPAAHSWVGSDPNPRTRTKKMMWFNLSWSLGLASGPLLAGPLLDLNPMYPFGAIFALGLIVAILISSLPHERHHYAQAPEEPSEAHAAHIHASERLLWCAWGMTLVANVIVGALRNVFPKRIEDLAAAGQLHLAYAGEPAHWLNVGSATVFSWLSFSLSFFCVFVFVAMGRTDRWKHRMLGFFVLEAVTGALIVVLGMTTSASAMLAPCAFAGMFGGASFFASAYYSVANPAQKHRRAAINEGVIGIGGFVGSLVAGLVATYCGATVPYTVVLPAVVVAGMVAQGVLLWRARRV